MVGGSVPFVLFFEGLARASSTQSAFIQKTLVVWVALLAVPLLGERLGPLHVAAIGTLVAGQAVLAGGVDRLRFGTGEWLVILRRRCCGRSRWWWPAGCCATCRRMCWRVARMGGRRGAAARLGGVMGAGPRWPGSPRRAGRGSLLTGVILAGYVALWFSALARPPGGGRDRRAGARAPSSPRGLNIAVKGRDQSVTGVGLATVLLGAALAIVAARGRAPVKAPA